MNAIFGSAFARHLYSIKEEQLNDSQIILKLKHLKEKPMNKQHFKIFFKLSILLLLIDFVQCTNVNKKNMTEYVESNIDYCMTPLINMGVDSLQARSICKCSLEEMFTIEPNLLVLTHNEWDSIFESNKDKIMDKCPELKKFIENSEN